MKTIRIYMSHPIRGAKGQNATIADMQANNIAAMRAANIIRHVTRSVGDELDCAIELYCPAEHDEFILIAYRLGYLSEGQILDVDCEIVTQCQALIWYSGLGSSKGAEIEIQQAHDWGIPIHELPSMGADELDKLENFVERICREN